MALKIYGVAQSRAVRVLWMAHELGIPFEHVPQGFAGGDKGDYLKINPNGRVPAIVDDDGTTLFESMAINLYLARKHDHGLAPKTLAEEGLALQWSFWVMTEVEKAALDVLISTLGLMGNAKDPVKVKQAMGVLAKPFGVLNQALAGREYLLGDRFTVADLNVASVMSWLVPARVDLSAWPNMSAWMTRCLGRPAAKKARGG